MSAHTPGPWSAVKEGGVTATKRPEWWVYADDAPYKLVAICQGPDAQANAQLVAYGPELREVIYWLVNGDTRISDGEFRRSIKKKATALLREIEAQP